MVKQKIVFESGNELAAYAAKQINYHVMGYYPITPSTQIAENLDLMKAKGEHDIALIAGEGEHSAAGICYGASVTGARVFNATSANGLLYALEQFPVQSGTRFPMVMNVACRTISGPLSIKGDHSDIMYMLNTGWIILFAHTPQAVYDMNICALKIAETVKLPVVVAFDGFFTSHQKNKCYIFEDDQVVQDFVGEYHPEYQILDFEHPITIGSYMNEPDLMNNKYQLHLAMEEARSVIDQVFREYESISSRNYQYVEGYCYEDSDVLMFVLGSGYSSAKQAVDELRNEGKKVGIVTINILRPFPGKELVEFIKSAKTLIICDRQDSYGANGGNMSLEIKAAMQSARISTKVITRIYGLGGRDFYKDDAKELLLLGYQENVKLFDYLHIYQGKKDNSIIQYFEPIKNTPNDFKCIYNKEKQQMEVKPFTLNQITKMPQRLAPGHGACPGCGIPVNVNLLLSAISGNVVLLFQTGCGMVVTTSYPKTSFKVPYVHNLFQNGAATLSGIVEAFNQKVKRHEYPEGEITFIMVSGDGGMDIGMGSALGAALRNHHMIIFEYDNGGYMNTGYQLSYSTPLGAKSSTSHLGKEQFGKTFFNKDTAAIMAATNIPYVATVAESNPVDFVRKAIKAKVYAKEFGLAYLRTLSACPLNWGDQPNLEKKVIEAGVNSCYFPLYEIENGKYRISYDPQKANKKIPIIDWFEMMQRTKHLCKPQYKDIVQLAQEEVDRRFATLKKRASENE
ncbi:thiamine pyrophosphate-dependent enzyme [Thomasclavelia sp.]